MANSGSLQENWKLFYWGRDLNQKKMVNKWFPEWSEGLLGRAGQLEEWGATPPFQGEGWLEGRLDCRKAQPRAAPCR